MKDDDTNNRSDETSDDLLPGNSADGKTHNRKGGPNQPNKKTESQKRKSKKWSLWQHWKRASTAKRTKWVAGGLALLISASVLGVYIVQTWIMKKSYNEQHTPLVINTRPPVMFQPFTCDVHKGLHTGNIQINLKNIGTATAYRVMPYWFEEKVVPIKTTGNPGIDSLPIVSCKVRRKNMQEMESPLPSGRELYPMLRQSVVSVPPIGKDDLANFYFVACVFYLDEAGNNHGTCDRYRMFFPSENPLDTLIGDPTFLCDGTPRMGKFNDTIGGHCQE